MYEAAVAAYPKGGPPHKDPEMSSVLYNAITQRSYIHTPLQRNLRNFDRASLFTTFNFWAGHIKFLELYWLYAFTDVARACSYKFLFRTLASHNHYVAMLYNCEVAYKAEEKVHAMNQGLNCGKVVEIHSILKPFKSYHKRSLVNKTLRIHDSYDYPAQDPVREGALVRAHLSKHLAGKVTLFADRIRADRSQPVEISGDQVRDIIDQDFFAFTPQLYAITSCFGKAPSHKQHGEDRIMGLLLSRFPMKVALYMFPLILKSFLRGNPPFSGKAVNFLSCLKTMELLNICNFIETLWSPTSVVSLS